MKRLFLIFLFLLISCPAWGATYYVRADGNNACNGTSPDLGSSGNCAWANHPWQFYSPKPTAELSADDIVYMRRGDTWYNVYLVNGQSGSNGHPITTTSVNTFYKTSPDDPLPVLSAAVDPSTLSWVDDGGNVYHAAATTQVRIVYFNGTRLTLGTGTSPTLNQFYWAANVLYVNVGADPSTGTLLAGKNNYVLATNTKTDSIFSFLDMQMSNGASGGIVYGDGARTQVSYCNISKSLYQLLTFTGQGSSATHNTITSDNTQQYGILFSGVSVPIAGFNTFIGGTTTSLIRLDNADGGLIYSNNANCSLYGDCTGVGITLNNSDRNLLHDNNLKNIGSGYYGVAGAGGGIRIQGSSESNQIIKNYVEKCYFGIQLISATGNGGNKVFYNTVKDSIVNGIDSQGDPGVNYDEVYNNTVIHNPDTNSVGGAVGHGIACQIACKKIKIANNNVVVQVASNNNVNGIAIADVYQSVYLDYNNIYAEAGGAKLGKLGGAEYTTLSGWQSAVQGNNKIFDMSGVTGQAEAHSISSDPLFISATNYHLQSGSPARGAGVNVGLSNTNPPDIGAEPYKQYVPWVR